MAFEIHWDKKAREFLRKMDKSAAAQIIKRVDLIKDNPLPFLEPLTGIKSFKLRAGDYRLILDINWQAALIEIRMIDHRSRIYKILK